MENIFEGAKFGDKFLCRNGAIALYTRKGYKRHSLYTVHGWIDCLDDGTYCGMLMGEAESCDIVSRYQEPINEEKLDELARSIYKEKKYLEFPTEDRVTYFKAGYRKAMEE